MKKKLLQSYKPFGGHAGTASVRHQIVGSPTRAAKAPMWRYCITPAVEVLCLTFESDRRWTLVQLYGPRPSKIKRNFTLTCSSPLNFSPLPVHLRAHRVHEVPRLQNFSGFLEIDCNSLLSNMAKLDFFHHDSSHSTSEAYLVEGRLLIWRVPCTEVWTSSAIVHGLPSNIFQYDQLFPLWCASCNATLRYFKVIWCSDPTSTSQAVNGQRPGWHSSSCPVVVANDAPANLAFLAIANMEIKVLPKRVNVRAIYFLGGWYIVCTPICIVNLAVSRSVRPSRQSQVRNASTQTTNCSFVKLLEWISEVTLLGNLVLSGFKSITPPWQMSRRYSQTFLALNSSATWMASMAFICDMWVCFFDVPELGSLSQGCVSGPLKDNNFWGYVWSMFRCFANVELPSLA